MERSHRGGRAVRDRGGAHTLWFTERAANKIGFVRLDTVPVTQSTPIGTIAFTGLCGAVLIGAQRRRRRRVPGATT
jgi:hypothetical protein